MITITLPPELEKTITERAVRQGMTPELFLLGDLRGRCLVDVRPELPVDEEAVAIVMGPTK